MGAPEYTRVELRMKESYGEGLASRSGLESCVVSCETVCEALTEVYVGQVLSREMDGNQRADVGISAKPLTGDGPAQLYVGTATRRIRPRNL